MSLTQTTGAHMLATVNALWLSAIDIICRLEIVRHIQVQKKNVITYCFDCYKQIQVRNTTIKLSLRVTTRKFNLPDPFHIIIYSLNRIHQLHHLKSINENNGT